MRSLIFGFVLILNLLIVSQIHAQSMALMAPPPTVASLGVADLISQDEVDRLWLYYSRDSNAVREEASATGSNFNDPQVVSAWKKVSALDESVHDTISKLIRNGYWLKTENRNMFFDYAVWLALQHIFDTELVDITLVQIRPLVDRKQMSGESYALMYDRNEISHGRPQVYGSQFQCAEGKAQVQTLLDPEHVDDRRRQMDMPVSFAEYEALMKKQCTK